VNIGVSLEKNNTDSAKTIKYVQETSKVEWD
jgi:hypothetical protein